MASAKIYAYTTNAFRRLGYYKIGGTTKLHGTDRVEEQDVTACPEALETIYESQLADGLWDDEVRSILRRDHGLVPTRLDKSREWLKVPEGGEPLTDEKIVGLVKLVVNQITDAKAGLKKYVPTPTQARALKSVLDQIESQLKGDDVDIVGVLDLCARFGKTLWVLELFRLLSIRYGYTTLLLPAYWLSAHTSFEKEISEFSDFNDFVFVDTSLHGWELKLAEAQQSKRPAVVSLSLCGDASDERLSKFDPIRSIPTEDVFMFCDEADVGTHTERSAKIIEYVTS